MGPRTMVTFALSQGSSGVGTPRLAKHQCRGSVQSRGPASRTAGPGDGEGRWPERRGRDSRAGRAIGDSRCPAAPGRSPRPPGRRPPTPSGPPPAPPSPPKPPPRLLGAPHQGRPHVTRLLPAPWPLADLLCRSRPPAPPCTLSPRAPGPLALRVSVTSISCQSLPLESVAWSAAYEQAGDGDAERTARPGLAASPARRRHSPGLREAAGGGQRGRGGAVPDERQGRGTSSPTLSPHGATRRAPSRAQCRASRQADDSRTGPHGPWRARPGDHAGHRPGARSCSHTPVLAEAPASLGAFGRQRRGWRRAVETAGGLGPHRAARPALPALGESEPASGGTDAGRPVEGSARGSVAGTLPGLGGRGEAQPQPRGTGGQEGPRALPEAQA